jgi:ArsR family transcriptional regulator
MEQSIKIFKILSDETRLRAVMLLAQQELCVCQLSGIMDVSQPKVSQILAKLRDTVSSWIRDKKSLSSIH